MADAQTPTLSTTKPVARRSTRTARSAFLRRFTPGTVLRWVVALAWVVVAVFPLWWTFSVTFSPTGAPLTEQFFPTDIGAGLQKIQMVFKETTLAQAILVTLVWSIIQAAGVVIITSMAAYEFALFDFPGKNALFTLALASLMVPQVVTLIPLFRIVISLQWLNTFQGLAVPGMASALALFIFRQFIEEVPRELMDAAEVDGATHFRVYRSIIMPICANAALIVAVLTIVGVWGSYLWPLVVSTKPAMYVANVIAAGAAGTQSWRTKDFAMTVYFLAAIPPIIIYILLQRKITQGFAMSGLKG